MIRINLLPRDERQVRRSLVLPKIGTLMPVLVLLLVAALFTAFSVVQAMQVGRLKSDIARAEQASELPCQIGGQLDQRRVRHQAGEVGTLAIGPPLGRQEQPPAHLLRRRWARRRR